jgi:hypothetical protein
MVATSNGITSKQSAMIAQEQVKSDVAAQRKQAVSEAVSLKETIFNAAGNAAIDANDVDTLRAQLATIMDSHKLDPWFARDVIQATTARIANTSAKAVALVAPATIAELNAAKPVREHKTTFEYVEADNANIGVARVYFQHNPNTGAMVRYTAIDGFVTKTNPDGSTYRTCSVKNGTIGIVAIRGDQMAGWYVQRIR